MQRHSLVWILSAVVMLIVAGVTYWLGQTLLPARVTAQTVGTIVPWYLTWGLVWMTVVISIILAWNLFTVGLNNERPHPISRL